MSNKGRPTTNPKITEIKIRATSDDKSRLVYCCNKLNATQYEIVMNGIDKIYNELNTKEVK